jgi:hypothetical protein
MYLWNGHHKIYIRPLKTIASFEMRNLEHVGQANVMHVSPPRVSPWIPTQLVENI